MDLAHLFRRGDDDEAGGGLGAALGISSAPIAIPFTRQRDQQGSFLSENYFDRPDVTMDTRDGDNTYISASWDTGKSPKLNPEAIWSESQDLDMVSLSLGRASSTSSSSAAATAVTNTSDDFGENAALPLLPKQPRRDLTSDPAAAAPAGGGRRRSASAPRLSVDTVPARYLACFALCGVGATVAYTAVLSALVWYKDLFGPSIFLLLNVAVYGPALPIMLLQSSFDEHYNRRYGAKVAYRVRITLVFVVLGGVLCFMSDRTPSSAGELIATTAVIGTLAGVAYGTFYQVVSLMPDGRCNAFFAMGYQGAGLCTLAVGAASHFNGAMTPDLSARTGFFGACAVIQLLCLLAFLGIDRGCDVYIRAMSAKQARLSMIVLDDVNDGGHAEASDGEQQRLLASRNLETTPTRWQLLLQVRSCACACGLTIFGSILLFPFYSYVQVAGGDPALPSLLFYSKLIADALSRPLTLKLRLVRTPSQLLVLALLRTLFIPIFFVYVTSNALGKWSAAALTAAIALFSFFSGYIITTAYHMAPKLLDRSLGDDVAKVMSMVFQGGLVVALLTAVLLVTVLE